MLLFLCPKLIDLKIGSIPHKIESFGKYNPLLISKIKKFASLNNPHFTLFGKKMNLHINKLAAVYAD